MSTSALALLLGKAAQNAAIAKRKGPPEDLIKAIADFRGAASDSDLTGPVVRFIVKFIKFQSQV